MKLGFSFLLMLFITLAKYFLSGDVIVRIFVASKVMDLLIFSKLNKITLLQKG